MVSSFDFFCQDCILVSLEMPVYHSGHSAVPPNHNCHFGLNLPSALSSTSFDFFQQPFAGFVLLFVTIILHCQIIITQFLSQLWHNCIVISRVGTHVDSIGAQVVDQVLKEVPAKNHDTW